MTCVRQDQDDRWLFGNATLRWVFLFTKHGFQAVFPLIKSTAGERQEPAGSSNNRTGVGRSGKRTTPMRKKTLISEVRYKWVNVIVITDNPKL